MSFDVLSPDLQQNENGYTMNTSMFFDVAVDLGRTFPTTHSANHLTEAFS
jgi:alanine dehydrogenase